MQYELMRTRSNNVSKCAVAHLKIWGRFQDTEEFFTATEGRNETKKKLGKISGTKKNKAEGGEIDKKVDSFEFKSRHS